MNQIIQVYYWLAGLFRNDPMSARSERNLKDVRPDLVQVIRRAWSMRGDLDFEVICGHRPEKEQNEAFESGHSQLPWPQSKHNTMPSLAVDVVPLPVDWENVEAFERLAKLIKEAAKREGVAITWGGDWRMRDLPHWEVKS